MRVFRRIDEDLARRSFLKRAARSLMAAPVASSLVNRTTAQQLPGKDPTPAAAPGAPRPKLTLNIRDFGASGDGMTKDTAAIQQAIDRCWVLGGGEALVPAGTYLTGAIALRSNTTLRLWR